MACGTQIESKGANPLTCNEEAQLRISTLRRTHPVRDSGVPRPSRKRLPGRVWRPLVGQPFKGIGIVWSVGHPLIQKKHFRLHLIKKSKSSYMSCGEHPPSGILEYPGRLAKGFQGGSGGLLQASHSSGLASCGLWDTH